MSDIMRRMTNRLTESTATAQKLADQTGKPYGVWEHVGLYGRPEGDIKSRHVFRVIPLDKPDPPDDWALVATVDPK